MAGIGPAIKSTGVTGGTKNSTAPGNVSALKNNKNISKLSANDLVEAEKKVASENSEYAKEEEKNSGETTQQVSNKETAERVTKPGSKLESFLETIKKDSDAQKAELEKMRADAANAAANQQGQIDPNMLAAMGKQQKPSSGGGSSGGSGTKPQSQQSKPSSNEAAKEALEKLNEQRKADNEKRDAQIRQMAEALKKEREKNGSNSDADTIAKLKKELQESKNGNTQNQSDRNEDSSRSGKSTINEDSNKLSSDAILKLHEKVTETISDPQSNPEANQRILSGLKDLEKRYPEDQALASITQKFENFVNPPERESNPINRPESQQNEASLSDYDSENSISLNHNELSTTDNRGEDTSLDFDNQNADMDKDIKDLTEDTVEDITEDLVEDEIEDDIEESFDDLIDDIVEDELEDLDLE